MAQTHYNPDIAPVASGWLALPELERIHFAQNYHVAARIKTPRMKAHATIHAAVENQIATGYGPSQRAVLRLQSEGLSRHESIHAIGAVIAQFIHELSFEKTADQPASFQSRMSATIERLHAKIWITGDGGG